jgi:hypothetical protein
MRRRPDTKIPTEVIPISKIIPCENYKYPKKEVDLLASKIKEEKGLIYPIIISPIVPEGEVELDPKEKLTYQIRKGWGVKRLEAVTLLGWKTIQAVVIPPFARYPTADRILARFAVLIAGCQQKQLSDFDIGKAGAEMEENHNVRGSDFGRILGITQGYTYNLIRWYRKVPPEVKKAWQEENPLITQVELDIMSHITASEAIAHWHRRIELQDAPQQPFHPNTKEPTPEKNGKKKPARRPSNERMLQLAEAIGEKPLKKPVRDILTSIVRFAVGVTKEVPGITDYKRLDPDLCEKKGAEA